MQEIENLRGELDQIHSELASLLRRRLVLTQEIWKIKIEKQLPFTDEKRELAIFHKFDDVIAEMDERQVVQNVLKCIVSESKKYTELKLKPSLQSSEKTSK
jgi:chorismate mutase